MIHGEGCPAYREHRAFSSVLPSPVLGSRQPLQPVPEERLAELLVERIQHLPQPPRNRASVRGGHKCGW